MAPFWIFRFYRSMFSVCLDCAFALAGEDDMTNGVFWYYSFLQIHRLVFLPDFIQG